MPLWLQIFIAVVGVIGTILAIVGFSAYWNERMKHKADKKNKQEDKDEEEIEKMRHEAYMQELRMIFKEEIKPIEDRLEIIESDLGKVKKGVQVTCRNDLEDLVDKADKQKFLSLYDKKRFESAYQAYHDLGKNGVMDATRERILALPENAPVKKTKKQKATKKQVLLESN